MLALRTVSKRWQVRAPHSSLQWWIHAVLCGVLAFVLYSLIGVARYRSGLAGNYDLGIFAQAAKGWASLEGPSSQIRGLPSLFADHFSPITVVFGAAWSLWHDPQVLILTQAACLGAAVAISLRMLPRRMWLWISVVATLPWAKGLISAAYFDVHEVGLGAPAMAALCLSVLDRRPRLAIVSAMVLALTKEDLGVTVVATAAVWRLRYGKDQTGVGLLSIGIAAVLISFGTIYVVNDSSQSIYLSSVYEPHGREFLARLGPALLFCLTCGFVGVSSPVALMAVPTLAWRLVSSTESYWQTYYHYDVILVPIAIACLADVYRRDLNRGSRSGRGFRWQPASRRLTMRIHRLSAVAVVLSLGSAAFMGLSKAANVEWWHPRGYDWDPGLRASVSLLEQHLRLPGPVAADQSLGVILVNDHDVAMLSHARQVQACAVVLRPDRDSASGSAAQKKAWLHRMKSADDAQVFTRDGVAVVVFDGIRAVRLPAPSRTGS